MYVILGTIAAVIFVIYSFKKKNETLKRKELPGPSGLPLVGCIFEFDESNMANKLSGYVKKFGDMFQVKMLSDTMVVLNSAELINKAFCSEEYKRFMNDRAVIFVGEHFRSKSETAGLSNGEVHKVLRRYFHQGLRSYSSGLQQLEKKVMTEMENLVTKMDNLSGEVLSIDSIIQRSLCSVISLLFSGEILSDDDPVGDMFWEHVRVLDFLANSYHNFVLCNFPFVRFLPGTYGRMCRKMKQLDEIIGQRYFYQQKETYVPGKIRGLADYYIELQQRHNMNNDGFVLHDHHIISQFADVVDAGMTTSSSAILNSFAILMNYPECQKKLQAELDHVIGRDRRPTLEDREKCTYMKAFEMEAHRYITVTPTGGPHMCNQDIKFEGFDIKANTTLYSGSFVNCIEVGTKIISLHAYPSWRLEYSFVTVSPVPYRLLFELGKTLLLDEETLLEIKCIINRMKTIVGNKVLVNVWHLHHDEKIWGDPWNFRPERFLDDSGNLLPKEHRLCQNLMPFGIGPRICPGQVFARTRYFLYLASLLQRWNFEFPPNQSISCDPRITENFEFGIVMRIKSLSCIAKKRF